MKVNDLMIKINNEPSAVFTFGRFQPPHIGHAMLLNKILKVSKEKKADHFVFVSQTHDTKKNPLEYDFKINIMKKCFTLNNIIDAPDKIVSLFDTFHYLANLGYKHLIMIAGSDRVSHYENIVYNYISINNPNIDKSIEIPIKTFSVITAGTRSISNNITNASSTLLRTLAINNNLDSFLQYIITYSTNTSIDIFNAIRNGSICVNGK